MSSNYQTVKDFFQERFPEANEDILKLVANQRLKGLGINTELTKIEEQTAQKLIDFFKTLSPEELQELTFNAMSNTI
ncbi:MAG: hypothetical protein GF365_04420 [Candidatus Buchananbacteria bacterium]|nr:hypothetical protein [Candidatus Buchananbacteria bacterium]